NHLDLAARTALEEMLGEFQGAIVFVSHDREFMDGLCNQVLEVGDGTVRRYDGNYSAWRAAKSNEAAIADAQNAPAKAQATAEARAAAAKAPEKRAESRKPAAAGKVRNPYLFEKLEKRIITREEELAALQASCTTEDVYRNAAKLRDPQMRIAEVERDLAD